MSRHKDGPTPSTKEQDDDDSIAPIDEFSHEPTPETEEEDDHDGDGYGLRFSSSSDHLISSGRHSDGPSDDSSVHTTTSRLKVRAGIMKKRMTRRENQIYHTVSFAAPYTMEPVKPSLWTLNSEMESLDYDPVESELYQETVKENKDSQRLVDLHRWFVIVLIAVLTAVAGCGISIGVDLISEKKFDYLKIHLDKCYADHCLYWPLIFWVLTNVVPVTIGSILVTYFCPVAAGSGIPLIKCYLNGLKVDQVVRFKTLLVKWVGVILSVGGGLACGKEGPMIHCGAVIAAGVSQGKSSSFNTDLKIFRYFRNDREKRDFVSAGAAAGVAAAFGSPFGGVLFALEEGASFWNQSLTWRICLCSMASTFTLNMIMSAYVGKPGQLSYQGLLNFGHFEDVSYSFYEVPFYLFMGLCGGLFGAFYNWANFKLTIFRKKYLSVRWVKVMEAALVAMFTAAVGFTMMMMSHDCRANPPGTDSQYARIHCDRGKHSEMAELWLGSPESTVRTLFHSEVKSWNLTSLSIFFICYFLIAIWTYGLSISGGLFIPCLLSGAAFGRFVAICALQLSTFFNVNTAWVSPGKFALIGAAAVLGGVVRMTISLTVILIEATGNLTFGIPIMITLIICKWVGDFFNEGLYDIHIRLSGLPLLGWDPVPCKDHVLMANDVMSSPVDCLHSIETVESIIKKLRDTPHNGFPVVALGPYNEPKLVGLILRWQLIVLLDQLIKGNDRPSMDDFTKGYPRYPTIYDMNLDPLEDKKNDVIDIHRYMNPASYTVNSKASLSKIFRLFRGLGLRHLVVTDDYNTVRGIVTRIDLASYVYDHKSHKVERLDRSIRSS